MTDGAELVGRARAWLQQPRSRPALAAAVFLVGAGAMAWAMTGLPALFAVCCVLSSIILGPNRTGAAVDAPTPPPTPGPDADWPAARRRFAALRSAYAAHECDPMAVLGLPALSDVTVASTARFVDAFAEAQALETDGPPPAPHAAAFVTAVERATSSWQAARDAADRIRLSHLRPEDRGTIERTIALLTLARDTDSDAERVAAYARARAELAALERAGVVRVPRPAQAVLETASRGRLPT